MHLIAGLGNPGAEYKMTRHNAGFMVIDRLAGTHSISLPEKKKFGASFGKGRMENRNIVLAKPLTYMNRSGFPLRKIADYYGINSKDLIVIHDDIDLAFGRIKIKEKGGHGGHKGIKSVMEAFGGGDFVRLRLGVGRSGPGNEVVGHVLGKFGPKETEILDRFLKRAREAVEAVLAKGVRDSMNEFNQRTFQL